MVISFSVDSDIAVALRKLIEYWEENQEDEMVNVGLTFVEEDELKRLLRAL